VGRSKRELYRCEGKGIRGGAKAADSEQAAGRPAGERAGPGGSPALLADGQLYCGKCGTPMQGCSGTSSHNGTKHYYYACGAARKKSCSLRVCEEG